MKYFITVFILFPLIALGQSSEIKSDKLRFHSIHQMGLIQGKKGNAFIAESIFGVQRHSWFAGLGVGIDHYYLRTLPVFIDLRKEFGKSPDRFFVYGQGGLNFVILREIEKESFGVSKPRSSAKRILLASGIGYKLGLAKNRAVSFSAGYSLKAMRILVRNDQVERPDFSNTASYHYKLQRIDMKLGLIF